MRLAVKAIAVWTAIMVLEVGNGLLRKVIVESFVDDLMARQIGVAMGSVMILLIIVPLAIFNKYQAEAQDKGAGVADRP